MWGHIRHRCVIGVTDIFLVTMYLTYVYMIHCRAIAAGCLVLGSKVAVFLKGSGSAAKAASLLLSGGAATAAYRNSKSPKE